MYTTEQINQNSNDIDKLPTLDALRIINNEDKLVALAVEQTLPAIAKAVDSIVARIRGGGRLFYVGTGTSGRLGVLDASECPPTYGVSPDIVHGIIAGGYEACYKAVEASEDNQIAGMDDLKQHNVTSNDIVVGITASGRTPYSIGAVEYARGIGALTISISCNADSEISRVVEIPIEAVVGPEVIAGSTRMKSGTAQKLILNMISTMTMVGLGYVQGNRMTNLKARNIKLHKRAISILAHECNIDEPSAETALAAADNDLPTAIVMVRSGKSKEEAIKALHETNYVIADAISLISA